MEIMESPLEILSLAAQMVDSARQNFNNALLREQHRSKFLKFTNAKHVKRNSAPLPELDEPLDMSLKSRKRAASDSVTLSEETVAQNPPKKLRPSPTSIKSGNNENENRGSKRNMAQKQGGSIGTGSEVSESSLRSKKTLKAKRSPCVFLPRNKNTPPHLHSYENYVGMRPQASLIISDGYSEEGINEHFRKSLKKYTLLDESSGDGEMRPQNNTQAGVDAHFLRSLGPEAWAKFERQYILKICNIGTEPEDSDGEEDGSFKNNGIILDESKSKEEIIQPPTPPIVK